MKGPKKDTGMKVIYLLTAVFIIIWSVHKFSLGVNKNFFFGQFAVIGIILLFFSIITKMNRKIRAEKINVCLEDGLYSQAAVLMDEYIREESVPAQTYLGRAFIALLQSDISAIDDLLLNYERKIDKADRYVMELLRAAITAKEGNTVTANQMAEDIGFDFSDLLNKDFYLPLVSDIKDYISALTSMAQGSGKDVEKIIKKREKNTLAGAYESIMNILWEKLKEGKIYTLPKAETGEVKKGGIKKGVRFAAFYILAALVLMVPSDFNLKDSYDSLRELNDRVNFLNEAVCAYGNDELYYIKYYDFNGEYNDLIFEVNDGKYILLTGEDRLEQFMEGEVDGRQIRMTVYSSPSAASSVLVIDELTSKTPSASAEYFSDRAFPVNIYSTDEINYTVFMGMYDGKLTDLKVDFDWGSVDIYDLY